MATFFSGAELRQGLENENLDAMASKKDQIICIKGMVKSSGAKDDSFLFAIGSNCERWVKIQFDMVESARHLGRIGCKDHWHTYTELQLHLPEDVNGRALGSLLAIFSSSTPNVATVCHWFGTAYCNDGKKIGVYGWGSDCNSAKSSMQTNAAAQCDNHNGLAHADDEPNPCECR